MTRIGTHILESHTGYQAATTTSKPSRATKLFSTVPLYITLTCLPGINGAVSTRNLAFDSFPPSQNTSTAMPPLMRALVIEPDGQFSGSAGRRVTTRGIVADGTSGACMRPFYEAGCSVRSIISSAQRLLTKSAAGYPKFASIWKMGSASAGSYKLNRFAPKLRSMAYCVSFKMCAS